MTIRFENFTHSYTLAGKPVFVPTELGRNIGNDIKRQVKNAYAFESFFYHLRSGGHVSALHSHRENEYFCKCDIQNYYYSVGRNRITRCLRAVNISRSKHYSKWSCVKNPYAEPRYSLPYGFVQSPILATLVLAMSTLGDTLRRLSEHVHVSVYVDDILLSSNNLKLLSSCFEDLHEGLIDAGFQTNHAKTVTPQNELEAFNCRLQKNTTFVLPARVEEFFSEPRTEMSQKAFERYCASISDSST